MKKILSVFLILFVMGCSQSSKKDDSESSSSSSTSSSAGPKSSSSEPSLEDQINSASKIALSEIKEDKTFYDNIIHFMNVLKSSPECEGESSLYAIMKREEVINLSRLLVSREENGFSDMMSVFASLDEESQVDMVGAMCSVFSEFNTNDFELSVMAYYEKLSDSEKNAPVFVNEFVNAEGFDDFLKWLSSVDADMQDALGRITEATMNQDLEDIIVALQEERFDYECVSSTNVILDIYMQEEGDDQFTNYLKKVHETFLDTKNEHSYGAVSSFYDYSSPVYYSLSLLSTDEGWHDFSLMVDTFRSMEPWKRKGFIYGTCRDENKFKLSEDAQKINEDSVYVSSTQDGRVNPFEIIRQMLAPSMVVLHDAGVCDEVFNLVVSLSDEQLNKLKHLVDITTGCIDYETFTKNKDRYIGNIDDKYKFAQLLQDAMHLLVKVNDYENKEDVLAFLISITTQQYYEEFFRIFIEIDSTTVSTMLKKVSPSVLANVWKMIGEMPSDQQTITTLSKVTSRAQNLFDFYRVVNTMTQ